MRALVALALGLTACGGAAPLARVMTLGGRGVQSYACTNGAWTLVAPRAELVDAGGKVVGAHTAGPSWTYADGSSLRGRKVSERVVDPAAIPWLVLDVVAHGGAGAFAAVTRVERVRTHGGKAPAGACEEKATVDVPYTADYEFYAPAP